MELDLLLDIPIPFEEADRAKKIVTAGSLRIPVVSLDHLIVMKRAAPRAPRMPRTSRRWSG
jgi:hypothetical protein